MHPTQLPCALRYRFEAVIKGLAVGGLGTWGRVFRHMDERRLESNQRVTKTGKQSVPINISWMTSLEQKPFRQDGDNSSEEDREPRRNTTWLWNGGEIILNERRRVTKEKTFQMLCNIIACDKVNYYGGGGLSVWRWPHLAHSSADVEQCVLHELGSQRSRKQTSQYKLLFFYFKVQMVFLQNASDESVCCLLKVCAAPTHLGMAAYLLLKEEDTALMLLWGRAVKWETSYWVSLFFVGFWSPTLWLQWLVSHNSLDRSASVLRLI